MADQELIITAKKLIDAGIQLSAIYEPIGCLFTLKLSDLPDFMADKDSFFAAECGLDKAVYVEWKAFVRGGCLCTVRGRRGPCSSRALKTGDISPQEYALRMREGSLLCSRHAKKDAVQA